MNHFNNEETSNDDDVRSNYDTLVQRNTEPNLNRNADGMSNATLFLAADKDEQDASIASSSSDLFGLQSGLNAESSRLPLHPLIMSNTADYRQSHRHIKVYQGDEDDIMEIVDFDSAFGGSLVGSSSTSSGSLRSNSMSRSSSNSSRGTMNPVDNTERWGPPPTVSMSTPATTTSQSIFPSNLFSNSRNNSASRFVQRPRAPYLTRSMSNLQQQQQQQQPSRSNNPIVPQRSRSSHTVHRTNNNTNASFATSNTGHNVNKYSSTRHRRSATATVSNACNSDNRRLKTVLSDAATVVESPLQYYCPTLVPLVNNIKIDTPLRYIIYDYSSYSGTYHPQHIIVNEPTQQASRWSSGFHDHEQFITLEFDMPVIARTITFGKFCKGHVCNMKEFKVFGGMHPEEDLREILHYGLKNDTVPETFALKYQYQNMIMPVKYLKIVPLAAFGASFNYSIWYVEIRGIQDRAIVKAACKGYENFKEIETTRLCLKYLRQKNLMDVFDQLQKRTGIPLEHPMVTSLHQALVVNAQFSQAEELLRQMYQQNMFQWYCDHARSLPVWKLLKPAETVRGSNKKSAVKGNQMTFSVGHLSEPSAPGPRGGHQMCIDVEHRKIYLMGGWDGRKDLADFWCFDIPHQQWHLLSLNTQSQSGPTPRSCHKICFDASSRSIFVFGGLMEPKQVNNIAANRTSPTSSDGTTADTSNETAAQADFYRYFIELDQWVRISENTTVEGGPELIYDHQMCIDARKNLLYVFGGRTQALGLQNYSGLYSYDIKLNKWTLLRNDDIMLIDAVSKLPTNQMSTARPPLTKNLGIALIGEEIDVLKSRVGHSMLFDEGSRSLLIFAGQRGNDYLTDFYQYYVDHNRVVQVDHQRRHKGFFNKYSNTMLASTTIKKGPSHQTNSSSPDEFYYTAVCGSTGSYTQRVTMDEQDQEMFVFSGYVRSNSGADIVKNTFWVYSMKKNEWTRVYHTSDNMSEQNCREREHGQQLLKEERPWLYVTGPPPSSTPSSSTARNSSGKSCRKKLDDEEKEDIYKREPCPRFAHQMVYDPMEKMHYIFGGNPNDFLDPTKRLNDFWKLRLVKPDPSSILKRCIYMVRMQHLKELCSRAYEHSQNSKGKATSTAAGTDNFMDIELNPDTLKALDYLRNQVAPVVNYEDKEEVQEFHQMCTDLCLLQRSDTLREEEKDNAYLPMTFLKTEDTMYIERTRLFGKLLEYIPEEMKEPLGNLTTNVVKIV